MKKINRPSVVTFTGGNHELVRDGVGGFVCMGTDREMIRDALEKVRQDRKQLPEMGTSFFAWAKTWIPEDFDSRLKDIVNKVRQRAKTDFFGCCINLYGCSLS